MNFAGVWQLPVVFVVTNNQWAISVPLKLQTASETLAQKAIAAGFEGEQVDGNDAIAPMPASPVRLTTAAGADVKKASHKATMRSRTTAFRGSRKRARLHSGSGHN
jgi:2-oxoisovalerate dehydrogenase E1 component alpha subunit